MSSCVDQPFIFNLFYGHREPQILIMYSKGPHGRVVETILGTQGILNRQKLGENERDLGGYRRIRFLTTQCNNEIVN